MTPEVAQVIVQTFLSELEIAKKNYQEAQATTQAATVILEAANIRLAAITNIKDSLLQFPDIMDAFVVAGAAVDQLI